MTRQGPGEDGGRPDGQIDAIAVTLHMAWAAITESQIRKAHPELFDGSQAFYPSLLVKEQLIRCTTPFEHLPEDHKELARKYAAEILAS